MKSLKILLGLLCFSFFIFSCVKETPPKCETDPRAPALGTYSMTDSVFFLGTLSEIREYDLTVQVDTIGGDTIVLENIFDTDFGLDLFAIFDGGLFSIPSQPDQDSFVSGSGSIGGNNIQYSAEYEDGGYSFIGNGTKN